MKTSPVVSVYSLPSPFHLTLHVLAAGVFLFAAASAQSQRSGAGSLAGTVLARSVISAGAVSAGGTLIRLQGSIGQPVIGVTRDAASTASLGFWYTAAVKIPADAAQTTRAPERFNLDNYPNPFAGATTVQFELSQDALVRLSVFDAGGREVRVLTDAPLHAGAHTATWDGTDDAGRLLASGFYLCAIRTSTTRSSVPPSTASIKAVIVR